MLTQKIKEFDLCEEEVRSVMTHKQTMKIAEQELLQQKAQF